jgi:hypothetical protein
MKEITEILFDLFVIFAAARIAGRPSDSHA